MAITPIPSVTPLPTPPSTTDPVNFDPRADAFLSALPTFQTENIAVADASRENALESKAQAEASAGSAGQAASSAISAASVVGATAFQSGFSYAQYAAAIDTTNFQTYRRKTAGSGTLQPSADPTNWAPIIQKYFPILTRAVAVNPAAVNTHYILTAVVNFTLPTTHTAGDQIILTNNSGAVGITIIPNASDKINNVNGNRIFNKKSGTITFISLGTGNGWVY